MTGPGILTHTHLETALQTPSPPATRSLGHRHMHLALLHARRQLQAGVQDGLSHVLHVLRTSKGEVGDDSVEEFDTMAYKEFDVLTVHHVERQGMGELDAESGGRGLQYNLGREGTWWTET